MSVAGSAGPVNSTLTVLDDCRQHVVPLTKLEPENGPCTIVVQPGPNWDQPIRNLFASSRAIDAEICFPVGTFALTSTLTMRSTGNIKVSGAGWGTKLVGPGVTALLCFVGCATAVVRDLAGTASAVKGSPWVAMRDRGIFGTLDFEDCSEVLVENVSLTCGSALEVGAACLAVHSDPTQNVRTGSGHTRIRASRFNVGEGQYGILLVHQARAFVDENKIDVSPSSRIPWEVKIEDPAFVRDLSSFLLSRAVVNERQVKRTTSQVARAKAKPDVDTNAEQAPTLIAPGNVRSSSVTVGKTTVGFEAAAPIASVLQTYVDNNGPKEFSSQGDLYAYLQTAARTLITDKAAQAKYESLVKLLDDVRAADRVVGARGIAVGGQGSIELRIRDNSIDNMQQGITAGVSYKQIDPHKPRATVEFDSMLNVAISGNIINNVLIPITRKRARWAIFVGNAASISIEQNDVTLTVSGNEFRRDPLPTDGIRVWGYLGHKLLICKNQVTGFETGVFVRALNPSGPEPGGDTYWITNAPSANSANDNLWRVSENYIAGSVIGAPACTVENNWPQPITSPIGMT